MNRPPRLALLLLVCGGSLATVATPAFANAGTNMMMLTFAHLVLGNALIGLLEGAILIVAFKARWWALGVMIVANYVSMLAGWLILRLMGGAIDQHTTIYNVVTVLVTLAGVLFVLTVLLEWPFCWLSLGRARRWTKAILASLLIQAVSYVLMTVVYLRVAQFDLVRDVQADRSLVANTTPDATIYYLSLEGDLCRIGVNGSNNEVIKQLLSPEVRLLTDISTTGITELWASDWKATKVLEDFAKPDQLPREALNTERSSELPNPPLVMRNYQSSGWEVGSYWYFGLIASNKKSGKELKVAMDTPMLLWDVFDVTLLPGDRLVFQLGKQIVLLDLNTRKIGLIAMGTSPVVVGAPTKDGKK